MTVETWGLDMEPSFHADESELFGGYIWKDGPHLPTPPLSPDEPALDFGMELAGDFPDLGYQYVADVLTTLPVIEQSSSSKVAKSEPYDSYFSKSDPMCSGIVKTELGFQAETMYPSVKSEPMDTGLIKTESLDTGFGKTESLDTGLVKSEPFDPGFMHSDPLEEPLDAIDSENFLDSIASYYEPKKLGRNHFGICSLPCDSDCEDDKEESSVASCDPKPEFHKEDVLNQDCMWNVLDDVKRVKPLTPPMEDCSVSEAYIPQPTSVLHYKPTPPATPKPDTCTNVKVPNGSIENSTLSDHCYYNNGLPTPSESDMDEDDQKMSGSEDSDDTVRMPNNQKEVLRFINVEDSVYMEKSLSQHLSAALTELRKNGKPITSSTILEVTIPGKKKYRLRVAGRPPKGKLTPLKEELIKDRLSPAATIVSPLRTTETRTTTVPTVGRPRRTTRKRQVAASPPVKATPKRRRQNTSSPRKRRTSSGSDSDGSEDTCRGGKRVFHNNMERQRRIHLRQSFDNLKYLVPSLRERSKAPKVLTLTESAAYCSHLGNQETRLIREKEALRAKHRELKIRLKLMKDQQPFY